MVEVKLAEAPAVLDVLKAPGPGSLTNGEKLLAGQAAREACPARPPRPEGRAQGPGEGLVRGERWDAWRGERGGRHQVRPGRAGLVA